MTGHLARVRIVVVSMDDAATLVDCLDGVAAQGVERIDVVVVDLGSSDGSEEIAIHHSVPSRVIVGAAGDWDRVVDAGATDLEGPFMVMLRADQRPVTGWLDSALTALRHATLVLGPEHELTHVALDRPRLAHLRLFAAIEDTDQLMRRVQEAGGVVTVAEGMVVAPARAELGSRPALTSLPGSTRCPSAMSRAPGLISVILCTRDRVGPLSRCLASLAALDDPCHEIVVVDNHDRATVVSGGFSARVRVVHEPRRGLDVARNRGIAEARGELVAYIDDDCEADPHWLDGLRIAFADPQVAGVTGRVRPASLATPAQRWFESRFSFDRGTVARRFTPWDRRLWYPLWTGGIGTGCNMAFRRASIIEVGGFDEVMDMGTAIGGGGDLDAFARLLDRGAIFQYSPDALVWHHHRASVREAVRQFWGYGTSVGALIAKSMIERPGLRLAASRFFVDRLRGGIRMMRQHRAGAHPVPGWMVLLDLAGQFAGVFVYLATRARADPRPTSGRP